MVRKVLSDIAPLVSDQTNVFLINELDKGRTLIFYLSTEGVEICIFGLVVGHTMHSTTFTTINYCFKKVYFNGTLSVFLYPQSCG